MNYPLERSIIGNNNTAPTLKARDLMDHESWESKNRNEAYTGFDYDENYHEETAAEISTPVNRATGQAERADVGTGFGFGLVAIVLAVLSLFASPLLFGALGIILGFIARARGARALGNWAIGISIAAIVLDLFISPMILS